MPGLEIHPLSDLRDEAAALLAARFARQRSAEPLLPEIDDFAPHVADLEGLVATRGGRAVAYLAGEVDGETARVGFAGHAATEPEALRDLYAVLADQWDVSRFAVAVPARDAALVDTWFQLAFGCQFVWGVRETGELPDAPPHTIRRSAPDDLDAIAELEEILWLLQIRPPSVSGARVPARDELRAEWSTLWDEPEYVSFVVEDAGRVVGHVLLFHRPEGDLRVPQRNIDLAQMVTLDDVRGTGVGLALTAHALRWAAEHGFTSMTIDWRTVNLLSSRFWPRRGFRPQYLRLYRAVP